MLKINCSIFSLCEDTKNILDFRKEKKQKKKQKQKQIKKKKKISIMLLDRIDKSKFEENQLVKMTFL